MKKLTLLLLLFWLPAYGLDYYWGTDLKGKKTQFEPFDTDPFHKVSKNWQAELQKLQPILEKIKKDLKTIENTVQKNLLKDNYYKTQNRLAFILISLNRTDEALAILKELEQENAGDSNCAENLAYYYEQKGDLASALKWTRTALERSTVSKSSNLNIYEKILEAKLKVKDNPVLIKTLEVMNIDAKVRNLELLDFNNMDNYKAYWRLRSKSRIMRERILIEIQRDEENDPVLACLIAELGIIYSMTEVCEMALPFLKKALNYGHPNPEEIKLKISKLEKLIQGNKYSMKNTEGLILHEVSITAWVISSLGVALFFLLLYLWWKEKKPRKKAKS